MIEEITIQGLNPVESLALDHSVAVMKDGVAYRASIQHIADRTLGLVGGLSTKSAAYTAIASDKAGTLHFDGEYTLSLTAAATLGNEWYCQVIADGGAVTIEPDGAETINGSADLVIPDGYSTTIWCDGSAFIAKKDYETAAAAIAGKADQATTYTKTEVDEKTVIANQSTAEAGANNTQLLTPLRGRQLVAAYNRWQTIRLIDLAGLSIVDETDLSDYAMLKIQGEYIHAAAGDTGQLLLRLSTDNGSSFTSTGYARQSWGLSAATGASTSVSAQPAFFLGFVAGNNAAQQFEHHLIGFNKVGIKRMTGVNAITYSAGADAAYSLSQRMENKSYAAADAIRILTNTSTITSGLLHIEGIIG